MREIFEKLDENTPKINSFYPPDAVAATAAFSRHRWLVIGLDVSDI